MGAYGESPQQMKQTGTPKGYPLKMPGYKVHKPQVQVRLKRIEGQVRGLHKMVDEDRYCIDVLTQVGAVKAALDAVALLLLQDHTEHCVVEAIQAGDGSQKVRELNQAVERLIKGR
jgi:DNA-binding FrmR family transcriptional regulator